MTEKTTPAPGKSCGTCTMCCKVYPIPAVDNKPANVWCKHCKPGQGCGIWEMRPDYCRDFHCHWLNEPSFGDIWKPSVSKFVMNYEDQNRFAIVCDPGHPTAWSREPYGPVLRKLAAGLLAEGRYMLVYAGATKHIVLPSHDVPVGRRDEDRVFSIRKKIAGGEETYIVDFDDAA